MSPLGRVVGTTLIVTLLATSAACSGGGSDRSTERFCDELQKSGDELDAQTVGAGDDLGSQVAMIFANISDFNAMLHRLSDRAPEEIRSDMEVAVEAWDAQADAASQAVSDPLGALAGMLASGVLASSSLEAVDAFAQRECGRVVFGALLTAANGDAPTLCPGMEGAPASLGTTATFTDLTGTLDELAGLGDDIEDSVGDLADLLDELDPEPRFAREALGRLAFENEDASRLLQEIDEAIEAQCTERAFGAAIGELVNEPAPAGTRVAVGNSMWGTPCTGSGGILSSGIAPSVPFSQLFFCEGGYAVVDLATGVPTYFDDPGVEGADVVNAGDRLVWIEETEIPAAGLDPELRSVTLKVQPFDGGDLTEVKLVDESASLGDVRFNLAYAWRDRILTSEEALDESTTYAVVRDGTGTEIARFDLFQEGLFPDELSDGPSQPIAENLFLINGREADALLDASTGRLIRVAQVSDLEVHPANGCFDRANVYDPQFEAATVWPIRSGSEASSVGAPVTWDLTDNIRTDNGVVARHGITILTAPDNGLRARGPDGKVMWAIPVEVAARGWEVVGGWIIVTNAAEEQVIVDPTTGTEAAELSKDVRDALTALREDSEGYVALYDGVLQTFTIATGSEMWKLPLSAICP